MYQKIVGRKIKVAIVGCGRISKNHFESIKIHKDHMELVAVCDINKEVFLKHRESYNINGYEKLEDLLQSEDLDMVILCTPSGLHSEHTILSAKYGVNVVCEKPMAITYEDGLAMQGACDDNNVRLFVVKQNRRNSTLQLLKRAIDENRFGQINLVHINVFWTRPQEYYDQDDWRGTWDMDGGAFMNQASHYVDLLDWLIGDVDSIQAFCETRERNIEAEDTGVVNVRWKRGEVGSMAVTMCTYPKNLEGSITVLGTKGTVRIGGMAVNEIQEWNFMENKDYDKDIKEANYQTTSVYGFGHPLYYKNIVDVMVGNNTPETDGREGLKSLKILDAIYESARENKIIKL